MSKLKVLQLCAAPGTGKNGVCELLGRFLNHRDDGSWLVNDNEFGYGGYTPLERHLDSLSSGLTLDSKDFALTFNLPRQLHYQEQTRRWAQLERKNIIMPGPFENLFMEVPHPNDSGAKIPLLTKMREFDFKDFELITIQLLLVPFSFEPQDGYTDLTVSKIQEERWLWEVSEEFKYRLHCRIEKRRKENCYLGEVQEKLDSQKLADIVAYTRNRTTALLQTHLTMGTPLVQWVINTDHAESVAFKIMEHI